ncbi:MAG: hypothetical protein JW712_03350, partial [Dehalococcoidales bacterium]|nr:hypothetical protein [Dehalococcoidales bacterium]
MQKHIIRKQILELRLPSPAQAFSIQELAGRIYREKVVHVIESCCNDTKSGDTVYRFDTLSIDIGSIPVNNLETEFPRKVEETLRRLLSERFNRSESNDTAERTVLQDSFAVSKKKSMIELFEYFIDYGTLPWWADGMTVDELDDILLQLTEEAPDEIIAIVHRIIHDKEKMNRLIYQFSDKVLPGVAGILLGHNPAPVLGFLEEFSFVLFQANVLEVHSENDLRLIFWREVFGHFTDAANSVPDVYRLFDNLTTSIAHQLGVEHSLLVDSVRDAVVYYQQHGHGFRSQLNTIISDMVDIPQSTSRSENTTLLPDFPVSEGDDSTGIKVDREMAPTLLREKLQAQLRSVEEAISSEGTGGRSRPESQTDLTGTSAAQRPENTAIQPHQHDQFTHNETPDPKPDKVKESRIISLDDENRTISDIPVSDSNDGTGVKSGQKITPFSQREKLQAQLRSVEEALSPEGTGGRSQPESPTDLPDLSAAPGLKNTVIQPRHKELDSPSKQPDSKPDKVKESRIISLDDEN